MRTIILILCCIGVSGSLYAQTAIPDEIIGTWKHNREGLTFQFNADGTFTMGEESEEARRALKQEQRRRGESAITSVSGTYTVTESRIEMILFVDGKTHKVRMRWKLINADTLRLDGQDYRKSP